MLQCIQTKVGIELMGPQRMNERASMIRERLEN